MFPDTDDDIPFASTEELQGALDNFLDKIEASFKDSFQNFYFSNPKKPVVFHIGWLNGSITEHPSIELTVDIFRHIRFFDCSSSFMLFDQEGSYPGCTEWHLSFNVKVALGSYLFYLEPYLESGECPVYIVSSSDKSRSYDPDTTYLKSNLLNNIKNNISLDANNNTDYKNTNNILEQKNDISQDIQKINRVSIIQSSDIKNHLDNINKIISSNNNDNNSNGTNNYNISSQNIIYSNNQTNNISNNNIIPNNSTSKNNANNTSNTTTNNTSSTATTNNTDQSNNMKSPHKTIPNHRQNSPRSKNTKRSRPKTHQNRLKRRQTKHITNSMKTDHIFNTVHSNFTIKSTGIPEVEESPFSVPHFNRQKLSFYNSFIKFGFFFLFISIFDTVTIWTNLLKTFNRHRRLLKTDPEYEDLDPYEQFHSTIGFWTPLFLITEIFIVALGAVFLYDSQRFTQYLPTSSTMLYGFSSFLVVSTVVRWLRDYPACYSLVFIIRQAFVKLMEVVIGIVPIVMAIMMIMIFLFGFVGDITESMIVLVQTLLSVTFGDMISDYYLAFTDGSLTYNVLSFVFCTLSTAIAVWLFFTSFTAQMTAIYSEQVSYLVESDSSDG